MRPLETEKDIERAWELAGDRSWNRAEVVRLIAGLLAQIRRLKRGKR